MIGVLASFAVDGRSRVALRRAREYEAAGVPFLWDSGAWSVFTGAAKVGVADHTAWIKAFGESSARFVALDVIGDAAATLANYRDQRAEGVNVEPTLHYGEPLDQIDDLLAPGDIEWFNVGGIVGALTRPSEHRNVAAFIAAVRRRLPPEVRIHALGCIHPDIVRLVSVDAADSTYWLNVARFRSLSLFDARRADWRKFSVCTTTRDSRRIHTWTTAYEAGAWLRAEYDLEPSEIAGDPSDDRLLAAAIESHRRFAGWAADIHQHPVTVYLAGAVQSSVAAAELLVDTPG